MKIVCIGRNYVAHIQELGNQVPDEPVFFDKPETALLTRNRPFPYPSFSSEIHHEIELVIKISKTGREIQTEDAHTHYTEIGLGLDFTARDLQDKAKKTGLPWFTAKGFDWSAPVSRFIPKTSFRDLSSLRFHLNLNGQTVQVGNSSLMIYPFDVIIARASRFFTLSKGDLIFTGTPAGVGPVKKGDLLEGFIEDKKMVVCAIQ